MTQLVITFKDRSHLANIRRIVKSFVGVKKVQRPRLTPSQLCVKNALRVMNSHCLMLKKVAGIHMRTAKSSLRRWESDVQNPHYPSIGHTLICLRNNNVEP